MSKMEITSEMKQAAEDELKGIDLQERLNQRVNVERIVVNEFDVIKLESEKFLRYER